MLYSNYRRATIRSIVAVASACSLLSLAHQSVSLLPLLAFHLFPHRDVCGARARATALSGPAHRPRADQRSLRPTPAHNAPKPPLPAFATLTTMAYFLVTLLQLCLLPFVAAAGVLLHLATSLQDCAVPL